MEYNHKGAKPATVEEYALVNRIFAKIEFVEKEGEPTVDDYNIGYGRMLKWLKLTSYLRK